ncbi:MAG: hypothetical protein GXO27_05005 [Chlorobi bacterium]|nr:hypothetical protein [Chlorobiota bacterium]
MKSTRLHRELGKGVRNILPLANARDSFIHTFGPDPDKYYILKKTGPDKYAVIDRCNGYQVISTMPVKEIYDQYGVKIQDAPVINGELDISQSGNTGDIRIIRVVVNGENVSKMVVKD